jgi:peptidyl-prolyl cis-trans isomerase SDCCAG10
VNRNARKAEIESLEADIRKLARRRAGGEDSDEERQKKKAKKSLLQQELDKYAKGRGLQKKGKDGKRKDEDEVIKALNSFRGKLKSNSALVEESRDSGNGDDDGNMDVNQEEGKEKMLSGVEEHPGMEVDDDTGFMNHALHFPKDDGEESKKAERDYEVIDPRQRNARAKEEERERKRAAKARGGGGGRFRR